MNVPIDHIVRRRVAAELLASLLLLAVCCLGCGGSGDGVERVPISGEVTLDGDTIEEGDIHFVAADGRRESAKIEGGTYDVDLVAGKKRVEIEATREVPGEFVESAVNPGEKEPKRESYVPARYNSKSELSIDVTADGERDFDFDLTSGPAG